MIRYRDVLRCRDHVLRLRWSVVLPPHDDDLLEKTFLKKVAAAVKKAFDSPGIMIAQLNGQAAGQTVFHLHFHILPRKDGLDASMHAREMADFAILEDHAARIRAAF